MLALAAELEKQARADDYFVKRKLFPNVDFYSGIFLRAMGIPVSMFTVLFAVARTVGWIAHWKEMMSDPKQKIGRPRQLYMGPVERSFTHLGDRHGSPDDSQLNDLMKRVDSLGKLAGSLSPVASGTRLSAHVHTSEL